MSDFSLLAATRSIEKSMAFVLYRFLLCMGVALGFLLATLAGAGTLVGFGSLAKNASALGPFGAVAGFGLFGFLMYRMRTNWLSLIDIPQLALLADQSSGKSLPTGAALIDYAKQRQRHSFPSISSLSELDQAMQQTLRDIAADQPLPPIRNENIKRVLAWLLASLSAFNHKTLLAWHFCLDAENPWKTAADGLGIHARHHAAMTQRRLYASLFTWAGFMAAYPLLLAGIGRLVSGIPINMSFWPYVFAGVFSWAIKTAFLDAIAEAAMMESFLALQQGAQEPGNPAGLAQRSGAYRFICDRAG